MTFIESTVVRDVALEAPENSTLSLSWTAPETTNGDILNYTVRIVQYDGGHVLEENTTNATFTATNLST